MRTIKAFPTELARLIAAAALAVTYFVWPALSEEVSVKTERFDRDPEWESYNNRVQPKRVATIVQDFGYNPTNGNPSAGSIGGRVMRAAQPAFYADKIGTKTLNDKLSASGTFSLTSSTGNSGIFFGWFNGKQPGGSGRAINSLGMDFDGEGKGGRLAVRMIGAHNKSCGTFITPFIPGKYRPTPIKNDGTKYHWTLNYDPEANSGKGRFTYSIKSESPKPEEFEGKAFTVDLPEGFKAEGATFDHFGLMNAMKAGGTITIFFSDLEHDGKTTDLTKDPGWEGSGNVASYQDKDPVGAHDFGFSPKTSYAGGQPGEVGGKFWRSGDYGYYADRIGKLTLTQPLEASGKVVLLVGAPDSDMFFGWFSSSTKDKCPAQAGDFLGVHVGGPTRVGHYFQPVLTTKNGGAKVKTGPVLQPEKVYDWSFKYDPEANSGKGSVRVTLANEAITLDFKPGDKSKDAAFDRFGFFTSNIGGQMVKAYWDDLSYSTEKR